MMRKLSETLRQERINEFTTECVTRSLQVQKQASSGVNFEDVNVDLNLTFQKLNHVTWLMEIALDSNNIPNKINYVSLSNAKLQGFKI